MHSMHVMTRYVQHALTIVTCHNHVMIVFIYIVLTKAIAPLFILYLAASSHLVKGILRPESFIKYVSVLLVSYLRFHWLPMVAYNV